MHTKVNKRQQKQCDECSALLDETKGRMVILDRRAQSCKRVTVEASTGPSCVSSVSETGESGDRREGLSPEQVLETLAEEYPSNELPILLTFHSAFNEFILFTRNVEVDCVKE